MPNLQSWDWRLASEVMSMQFQPQKIEEIAKKLGVSPRVVEQYLHCREVLTSSEAAPKVTRRTQFKPLKFQKNG